jgi:hypothetical protein
VSTSFADSVGIAANAQHVDLRRVVSSTPPSASKDGEDQTQNDADNDAGNDREIERAVLALDSDVTRQTAEPFWSEAAPQNESEQEDNGADYHQKFPDVVHFVEGCANRTAAQG